MTSSMRVKRGRSRAWGRDRRGNVQVVETMIVGLLVVSAIVAVSTLNVPTTTTESFKRDNERLVKDSLFAMLNRPSDAQSGTLFGSVLEEYVMEAIAGNQAPLREYLNLTLPPGAQYNVYLDNGYGPPYPVLRNGAPPREAVAASVQFVPQLAYTFMVPEFRLYHGDFHQNMYGIPVRSGVLVHDEGTTVELAVTFRDAPVAGEKGEEATLKRYSHTALRANVPNERSWPSVEIYYPHDHDGNAQTPTLPGYYIDFSDVQLYGDRINYALNGGPPIGGNAYNFTFPVELRETAGVEVPKGAQITLQFPRGWDFNASLQDKLKSSPFYGNAEHWEDWSFEGEALAGWTVKARLKEGFTGDTVRLMITSNYRTIFDTAYPYFNPVVVSMGGGVQGQSTLIVKPPSSYVFGVFMRETYLSTTKPLIAADTSTWGLSFTNAGAGGGGGPPAEITNITLKQPEGLPIIASVTHLNGWLHDGVWKSDGANGFYWDREQDPTIANGELAWLAFEVTGGFTEDNHYRNEDYQTVQYYHSPSNTTGTNMLGVWDFEQRAWFMNEEWVYVAATPPADGDEIQGTAPGWPDWVGNTYTVGGGTYGYRSEYLGATAYKVLASGASSNTFGDYQGTNVFSDLEIVDRQGLPEREFAVGGTVTMKTNFTQLIGRLSALNDIQGVSVSDLIIRASVYTPEKAWKGLPQRVFEESAAFSSPVVDPIEALHATDINGDTIQDVILITATTAYALDGRDGSKFWTVLLAGAPVATDLVDANDDGFDELLVSTGAWTFAYDVRPSIVGDRELWKHKAAANAAPNQASLNVTHMVDVSTGAAGTADVVLAASAAVGESSLIGLDVTLNGNTWSAAEAARYSTTELVRGQDIQITDVVALTTSHGLSVAFASQNHTVTLLSAPDLAPLWVSGLPQDPIRLHVADLDRDGDADLVVDTHEKVAFGAAGTIVYTLTGDSGHWGSSMRNVALTPEGIVTRETGVTSDGGIFAVGANRAILEDTSAMYSPSLSAPTTDFNVDPHDLNLGISTNWMGLHTVEDKAFIIDDRGRIMKTLEQNDQYGFGYLWTQLFGPDAARSDFRDVHAPPDYPASGTIHRFTEQQAMRWDGVAWQPDAGVCTGATATNRIALDCTGLVTKQWLVDEDAAGNAQRFLVLLEKGGNSYLYAYDIATASWSQSGSWTNTKLEQVFEQANGDLWVVGHDLGAASGIVAVRPSAAPVWTTHNVFGNDGFLTSVLVQADGTGWTVDQWGRVWHRAPGDTVWASYAVDGWDEEGPVRLVEDLDGVMWLIGDDFKHAPLNTRALEAWADLGTVFNGGLAGNVAPTTINILSLDGQLGGSTLTNHRSLTAIDYWYKRPGDAAWTPLTGPTVADDPGIVLNKHEAAITCTPVSACSTIAVQARLRTRTITDNQVETLRQDGTATPLLKDLRVQLIGSAGEKLAEEQVDPALALSRPATTANWSAHGQGLVLGSERTPWSYRGVVNDGQQQTGGLRHLAVTARDPVDGSAGQDIVVAEESVQYSRWFVLDGLKGAPQAPLPVTPLFGQPASDIDGMVVTDADNDGREDVVFLGDFDDEGMVYIWRPADGGHMDGPVVGPTAKMIVDTGRDGGRATFVLAGSGSDVISVHGQLVPGADPELRWSVDPFTAQGLATFEYVVPANAMFGTGIVVAELIFNVDEGAGLESQTARLVDWFQITPPGRAVPVPPVYTVEIVSWFNET